jgi:hypothetical protein
MRRMFKRFPPGLGHVQVPVTSSETAAAAITMYAACRHHTQWLQTVAWTLTKHLGPWILPGRTAEWRPPVARDLWEELLLRLAREFGRFSDYAVSQRRQESRSSVMLLLFENDKPKTFVKVRFTAEPLDNEYRVLQMVLRSGPASFFVPGPLGYGSIDGIQFLATEPLPAYPHRVAVRPPLTEITSEIDDALHQLPRSSDIPPGWRPMHGDFTPWNLRMFGKHGLALYDWEDAGWGPPNADEMLYLATSAALGRRLEIPENADEAAHFWLARYASSRGETRDALIEKIDKVLVQMTGRDAQTYSGSSDMPDERASEDLSGRPEDGLSYLDTASPERTDKSEERG